MNELKALFLICIFSFIQIQLFAQQNIPITIYHKCDSLTKSKDEIKVKTGKIPCLNIRNEAVFFQNNISFQDYLCNNTSSHGFCENQKYINLDFNKYDVLLIEMGFGRGYPDTTYRVFEKEDRFIVTINFSVNNNMLFDKDSSKVSQFETDEGFVFLRYFLLPKGKKNKPSLKIYKTIDKCY